MLYNFKMFIIKLRIIKSALISQDKLQLFKGYHNQITFE